MVGNFICYKGKMLTNGSAPDIFALSLMLGIMNAMLIKKQMWSCEKETNGMHATVSLPES